MSRRRFDELVDEVIRSLPERVRRLLDETPLVVEDEPPPGLLEQMGMDPEHDDLCGLHTGTPLLHRSVDQGHDFPETVYLFRRGIVDEAGGWEMWPDDMGVLQGGEARIREEIRITLLHELGHHFGLEDDDLEGLGYG